jgi:RsiW-degrading membrane proteinase PrsW (M82 family)
MNTFILLILAIAPAFAIGYYIYLKDIRDKEPSRLITLSVLCGALSFFVSIGLGLLLHRYTHIEQEDVIHQMIKALIFVGLVEEGSKFLFLRGILFYNRNFTEPFDGIVYSVMVGMGFATTENILYIYNGGGGTALIRMFTAVPAHAVFAVIMGFFIGEAKVFKTSRGLYSGLALGLAAFVHGYYDYFLFLPSIRGLWLQAIAALIITVVLTHFAIKLRRDEIIKPD